MSLKFVVTLVLAIVALIPQAHADRCRSLEKTDEAFQARADLILQAKSEILVEYFLITNDDNAGEFLALLVDSAKKGKTVKILMDALSSRVPTSLFPVLLQQGNKNLEIKVYNDFSFLRLGQLGNRDHSKLLIADGEVLIAGGRNIGNKYFRHGEHNYMDFDLIADGKAAADARESFLKTWNSKLATVPDYQQYTAAKMQQGHCVGRDAGQDDLCETSRLRAIQAYNESIERMQKMSDRVFSHSENAIVSVGSEKNWLDEVESCDTQFLSHKEDELVSPQTAKMTHEMMGLALTAKRDVTIVSPYLVPTAEMISTFKQLLEKNIKLRIITNSMASGDDDFAITAYRDRKEELIKMGFELYEFKGPETLHAKVMLIDGEISVVGSFNLDPRSAEINREVGLVVKNGSSNQFADNLKKAMDQYVLNSTLVGKDGEAQNREKWEEGVSPSKMKMLRLLKRFLFLFKGVV